MGETSKEMMSGLAPYLTIRAGQASAAIAFYQKAFGAEEVMRMPTEKGDKLMHAHILINGGHVLMSDDFPEYLDGKEAPAPASVSIHLQVDDADAWWERAVKAGAEITMPLDDQFWGDRFGQLKDPFGHAWSIGAPIKK